MTFATSSSWDIPISHHSPVSTRRRGISGAKPQLDVAYQQMSDAVVITNHLHGIDEIRYINVYICWKLIYRNLAELESPSSSVPGSLRHSSSLATDDLGCIGFLSFRA
jgi:hypothetical protein